ncbi:hypothetical protein Cadr_000013584 [Camelus dromedarius]|uniref:Uncharacterized protein n=1 Tax=Camelus dromedarius TaxID=9838 RepID=A0A5N4DDZ3_CAMDR|nr:hypothetical protein Cadr_000013584 [Camelus dromedarius]
MTLGAVEVTAAVVPVREEQAGSLWGLGEEEGQRGGRSKRLSQPTLGTDSRQLGKAEGGVGVHPDGTQVDTYKHSCKVPFQPGYTSLVKRGSRKGRCRRVRSGRVLERDQVRLILEGFIGQGLELGGCAENHEDLSGGLGFEPRGLAMLLTIWVQLARDTSTHSAGGTWPSDWSHDRHVVPDCSQTSMQPRNSSPSP